MNRYVWLSAMAYATGLMSLVLAVERPAAAQCTPTLVSPAYCQPAYVSAPTENTSGSYCAVNADGQCVQDGDDCEDRYGIAFPGKCKLTSLGGTGPTQSCTEDDHISVMQVKWYVANCTFSGGDCSCLWSESNENPDANIGVCDCKD